MLGVDRVMGATLSLQMCYRDFEGVAARFPQFRGIFPLSGGGAVFTLCSS